MLAVVQTAHREDLRPHAATLVSRVDDHAFSWREIAKREAHDAKRAPAHLKSAETYGQAVGHVSIQLAETGLQYRRCELESV